MTLLYVANFDFEHQLARQSAPPNSDAIDRINRELATAWVAIAEDGDFIWTPGSVEPEFFARLTDAGLPAVHPVSDVDQVPRDVEVCPWGWSPKILEWSDSNGWNWHAPARTAVAEANSRRLSSFLEKWSASELAGAATVRSREQFSAAVAALPTGYDRWVVKAEFSMSARERILGTGRKPDVASMNWVEKRLRAGEAVYLEPWVERLEEVGLQFTIPWSSDKAPVFEGCTPLLTHPTGQYRGSRFAVDASLERRWQPVIEIAFRAIESLKERGYFGPVGIDSIRYREANGAERFRPLQDINARYTMGRLALGFRRLLTSGQQGSWLHVRWSQQESATPSQWLSELVGQLPNQVRVIPTTPFLINGLPTRYGSLVVLAPTAESLIVAEQTILARG